MRRKNNKFGRLWGRNRNGKEASLAARALILFGLFLAALMSVVACERVTVDPKEIDLATPYIPDLGGKRGTEALEAVSDQKPDVLLRIEADVMGRRYHRALAGLRVYLANKANRMDERARFLKVRCLAEVGKKGPALKAAAHFQKDFPKGEFVGEVRELARFARIRVRR